MKPEPIYWLFSSSAQAVATFIAFLLAGFAIVLQLMDSAQERDETLQPIHNALKQKYHHFIVFLLILTGLSIISSLGMIYINSLEFTWTGWPALAVFILNAAAIGVGIWFVTQIIDPARYEKEAVVLLAKQVKPTGNQTPRNEFFDAFVDLESDLRRFIKKKKFEQLRPSHQKIDFSFRQMIQLLHENDIIDNQLYEKLLALNKTRNLIFHGHLNDIDTAFVNQTRQVHDEIRTRLKLHKNAGSN